MELAISSLVGVVVTENQKRTCPRPRPSTVAQMTIVHYWLNTWRWGVHRRSSGRLCKGFDNVASLDLCASLLVQRGTMLLSTIHPKSP
jgi:hypothetical protein